jgi:hypothetical protein
VPLELETLCRPSTLAHDIELGRERGGVGDGLRVNFVRGPRGAASRSRRIGSATT